MQAIFVAWNASLDGRSAHFIRPSGLSTLIEDHLAGGASRLAALLLPQILPVFSVVAPCHPGAALRDLVLVQRGQATRVLAERLTGALQKVALALIVGAGDRRVVRRRRFLVTTGAAEQVCA